MDEARVHISDATKDLARIVVHEEWGYLKFEVDYRKTLDDAFTKLLMIKRDLE